MAVLPTWPPPEFPFVLEPEWKTVIVESDGDTEQRRSKRVYAVYNANCRYSMLYQSEMQTLYDFYMARKGAAQGFYAFDVVSMDHAGLYVATADGAQATWDLPGKSTSGRSVYVNGALETGVTFLSGGGEGEVDRVQFSSSPSAGDIITVDLTGYLRFRCRFAQDKLSREVFAAQLFNTGVSLKGLPPA